MTRKHFIAIAEAIRISVTIAAEREAVARALVPALRAANPKFDTDRFMDAVQRRQNGNGPMHGAVNLVPILSH